MDYLSVKNLTKYQHYKQRNPPWVKLHRNFWIDEKIDQLTIIEKLLFLGCLTLASESGNRIPKNHKYISKRLSLRITQPMLDKLQSLTLLCSASDSASDSALSLSLSLSKHPDSKSLDTRKQKSRQILATRTSKVLTPIEAEIVATTDKHFPPV